MSSRPSRPDRARNQLCSAQCGPPDRNATCALEVRTRWLSDHRFELRGHAPDEELALIVPAAPAVRFRPGATDLVVARRRAAVVSLQVRHDLPPPLRWQIHASLVRVGSGEPQALSANGSSPLAADELGLRFPDAAPGRYRLRVHLRGDRKPLAELDGITVEDGRAAATILSVDVRGLVRLVRLRVVDGSGAPVRSSATLLLTDGVTFAFPIGLHDSVFTVPVGQVPPDAVVRASGFREQQVHAIAADGDLVLLSPPALRVRVQAADTVPPGVRLHAFLARSPRTPSPFAQALGPLHGSGDSAAGQPAPGEFVFLPSRAGAYCVTLVLEAERDQRAVVLGEPWPVTVEDAGGDHVLEARVDPEALQAGLRALGR